VITLDANTKIAIPNEHAMTLLETNLFASDIVLNKHVISIKRTNNKGLQHRRQMKSQMDSNLGRKIC